MISYVVNVPQRLTHDGRKSVIYFVKVQNYGERGFDVCTLVICEIEFCKLLTCYTYKL